MAFRSYGPSASSSGLQSFTSLRGSQGHHVKGKLLSLEDIRSILEENIRELNESGEIMLETLDNVTPHDFQLTQQEFPIFHLQHVTDQESMESIYNHGGFQIINPTSRPGFGDLSYWSADIASEDVEDAREKSYEDTLGVISPRQAKTYEEKIKDQFANSPAFNPSASRYGNFKFSFPLVDLLGLYQEQHCGGEEAQMRILGTDLYKQEIVHFILVHSPDDAHQFRNLPMVPAFRRSSKSLPFVYEKKGYLYWRPESTSSVLRMKISEEGIAWRECPVPCDYFEVHGYCRHIKEENYQVWSVWNHLVFAFHLPNARCLEVPKGKLLNNLTACGIEESPLIEEERRLEIEEAEDIIQQMKDDFRMRKKMRIS